MTLKTASRIAVAFYVLIVVALIGVTWYRISLFDEPEPAPVLQPVPQPSSI